MATSHMLEYSKSSKATCHGPPPCNGSPIAQGAVRYGKVSVGPYGETVEWRHWGCVTPDILESLARTQLERVPGFGNLRAEDQGKIRIATARRRVDPNDIPASAKAAPPPLPTPTVAATPMSAAGPSQKARRAALEAQRSLSSLQQPATSQSAAAVAGPSQRSTVQPTGVRPLAGQAQGARQLASRPIIIEDDGEDLPEEQAVQDELYVTLRASIVGVQYYKGMVAPEQEVRLVREPTNKYDRNAIKVENIGREQVGHIPRQIAAKLAPLMDRNEVTVEGVMLEGNMGGTFAYSLAMNLKIYAPSDNRAIMEPKLIWATPGQRGFAPLRNRQAVQAAPTATPAAAAMSYGSQARGPAAYAGGAYSMPGSSQRPAAPAVPKLTPQQILAQQQQAEAARRMAEEYARAQELRLMLDTLEKVNDEGRRTSLLDTLCNVEDVLALPLHPNPPGKDGDLRVDLLKHQSQALQWALDREYPQLPKTEKDQPVQLWQYRIAGGKPFYFNLATKTPQGTAPVLGRGALCADSMGLGKTLTMLALILATKQDNTAGFVKSTLIVVPLSVMSNWEKQIEDHVRPGALTSCTYYGTSRNMSAEELQKYDVVITTYQTVSGEYEVALAGGNVVGKKRKKSEKALFDVPWKRVILDEGHNIRNPKTKMAKAACALTAERRWVLTGTPIINSPKDLGSILTFLQICRPLDNEDFFKRMVLRPLKDGVPSGAELLRALMSQICIHRTKEMQDKDGNHLVPLPPVDITVIPVELTSEARELYDAVEDVSKQRLDNLISRHGSVNAAAVQSNVLSMLTRLRQLALHPGLLPPNYLEKLRIVMENEEAGISEGPAPAIQLTAADRVRLQGLLAKAIEDNEECPICFGILEDPRITSCAHSFCFACINEVIARNPACPMDRRQITPGDLIEPAPPTELTQAPVHREEDDQLEGIRAGSSAKIDQLVQLLQLTPPTEKSLVFSQFTSFLDKIGETLDEKGISYVRFDGQMSAKRRQETIARFSVPIKEGSSLSSSSSSSQPATSHPTPAPQLVPAESQPLQPMQPPATGRARRQRKRTATADTEDASHIVDDDGDADFVAGDDPEDDDDFIDDGDDDERPAKRKKGKGKPKSKGKAKAAKAAPKPSQSYDDLIFEGENPKVMLISLKAGALGLNLTVANNVYLMDPWWQEGIESQAIDRCNRIGQTKPVHVYQLVAENTVEAKVLEIQEKKKKLINEAFSGIKSKQSQRQKREARAQELIALFGSRDRERSGGSSDHATNETQTTLDNWTAAT